MSNKSFGKYITLKEASRLCPYSAQYLGLRARQGKLKAIKIGRDWMTTKEWLEEYINQVQKWKENQSSLSLLPSKIVKSLLSIILFLLFFYSFSFAFEQQGLFPIKDNLLSPSTIFKPLHKEKLYASLSLTSPSTYSIFSDLTQSFSFLARQIVYPKPLSLSSLIGNKPSYTPSHNVSFSDKYLVLEKQLRSLLIQQQIKDQEIEELKQEIANLNKEGIPTKEIIKEVQQITQIQPKEIIEKQIKVLASKDLQDIKQELETIKEWKKDIDNLRLITQKLQSRPSYTTASTAPLYVGTQGIQVGGHGNFDSLGVSGSASIEQSLGVSGSVTLGSPNSSTDQLIVNSTSQFREPVTFEKGATFGTSTLTIDENGNLETTGTITAQNIQIQDTGTTTFGGVTYTWPTSGGTNDQVLATDGSGNLSWQTISSGNLNASYLVLSLDDNLTNERVLTQGEGISFEDTRANGTLTISLDATTDIIPEGTNNLYFTQQRFDTAFSNKTTDDLTEGTTNLYYTDSRARQVLSATAPITYNSSTGVIGLTTPLSTTYGGTGIDTSSSTGVPSISSGTWSVNSVLPLSLGGTNANLTGTSGGIVYSTDSALAISSAGTSGQILTSQGTSAPSWSNIASLLTAGTNISITGTTNATIATVNNPVFSTSVTTPLLLTSSGAITIETGASTGADDIIFKPAGEEKLRIEEDGDLFFEKGTYDTTLTITTPTANRTITFPDATGTVAVSATAPITLSSEGTIGLTTPLATTYGGTGLSSIGTANQLLGVDSSASGLEYKTLQGTTNQITVTHSAGTVTLSTPQDIGTSSSPTFSGLTLSSLTQGSVLFVGSSGTITEDNSNLYWDNTNKTLGIGTTSPNGKLHIKTNSDKEVARFEDENGNVVVVDKDGNIGIGTITPEKKLHVSAGAILLDNNQNILWKKSDGTIMSNAIRLNDGDDMIFNAPTHNRMAFQIGGLTKMLVDENGNIGIGTTSPGAKLDVDAGTNYNVLHLSSDATTIDPGLYFTATNVSRTWGILVQRKVGKFMIHDDTAGTFPFEIEAGAPNESFDIQSDGNVVMNAGNVGIGTASPEAPLDIAATGTDGIQISGDSRSVSPRLRFELTDTNHAWTIRQARTDDDLEIRYANNGTDGSVLMIIRSDGNVGIGTTNPGSYKLYVNGSAYSTGGWHSSDLRLKKNIEPLNNVLGKIKNINGVKFDWRVDEFPEKSLPEERQIGIIAQEVEKEFPELVSEDNEGYKALAYDRFTAVLLEAIKEQQNQIEEIQSQLQLSIKEDSSGKIIPQQPQTDIKGQLLSLGLVVNENGVLEVRKLKADELCVGNVCINEEQLKKLLEKAEISATQNSKPKSQPPNPEVKTEEPNANQDLDNSSNTSENLNPEDAIDTTNTTEESCIPNWQCSDWQPLPDTVCLGETFIQTRECVDSNECGVETEKPEEKREMTAEKDCSETAPDTTTPTTTTSSTALKD